MTFDASKYQPLILDEVTVEALQSPQYERFIYAAAIEPGVRLLLDRHRRRPDWPYVDTKFNPNTGADLPDDSYQRIYPWFLGRGSESLAGHLDVLDKMTGLTPAERWEAERLFRRLLSGMTDTIIRIAAANSGRCPFRVNLDFKAIDEAGQTIGVNPNARGAGDTFCAKGLIAEGSPDKVARGVRMLVDSAAFVRGNAYGSDQGIDTSGKLGHGARMLAQAAALLTVGKTKDRKLRAAVLDMVAEFMAYVLGHHVDPVSGMFSEYLDAATKQRLSFLDPGHANEFVGLGLGAVEAMEAEKGWPNDERRQLIARAKREMPRVLLAASKAGWNHTHDGLHKGVDPAAGTVVIDDMPWWNLPETMRAAVRADEVADDDETRRQCLQWLRLAHNAYFKHYPNRGKMLFPFQTRSGATGEVVDRVPAVPEGDPLYHTNLSLLDMLAVIRRLK